MWIPPRLWRRCVERDPVDFETVVWSVRLVWHAEAGGLLLETRERQFRESWWDCWSGVLGPISERETYCAWMVGWVSG